MEFFGLPGEPLVPLFCSFANRACPVPIVSVSPFSVFSHSFLLSALILLKVPGWPSSLGRAEVCPSRHPHFWRLPLFPFFPIWAESCSAIFESRLLSFFFPVLVPRGLFCLCHERSLAFFLLLFLVFFFCLFLSSCPSLPLSLCLKGSAPLDGSWGSLLLIPCRDPLFLDVSLSGLQDPLGFFIPSWVSCVCYFGLSLIFPFGLDLSFWAWLILLGFLHYDPF